jgi:hypothetical protein
MLRPPDGAGNETEAGAATNDADAAITDERTAPQFSQIASPGVTG